MIQRDDPQWYKDAVIYQVHVKSFFDSNNDGIGDFPGLIEKLDYIQDLGVTVIWLLPFYPSPLRDDGYDIADYRNINPSYGTMRDFRRFIRAAHERNIRVITELVINHTSDQHPWFQRARKAKPGSAYRDFYVWSDTDHKFEETRIIFLDTENSNWAWDAEAKAYYWHRFYSHQPDLNFDNPRVLREVLNVLHYWFDMGVDGLRLDAVPYLVEREGTNNENLPETHAILKKIRAEVDAHFPDRMLLAEANQWPEDTQEYFGSGDECHMAFHFPLMPRMYMAIAQEDRYPITDIIRQMPEIPDNCQWAIFLRNHDELTLEMVTDQERDYLWETYASDRRARLNLGIRRRLAPLLERDRRKIELMNALLLSMPGTPVIYYGDELGMGDNIFLGDRDGVRTPMQWSPDRNAGFSKADPARLFLPPIMDPIYGFGAVNVEAQQRDVSSLLNWTKRMVAVRQARKAFGRGEFSLLYPGNRKILAYLVEHGDEVILCVANLSRSAQAVELDLSRFKGRVPVELLGRTTFPPIGDLTYLLTLTGYGFYWFVLAEEAEVPSWHQHVPEPLPEFVTIVLRHGWQSLGEGDRHLEVSVLPSYLPKQRWFAAKDDRITAAGLVEAAEVKAGGESFLLAEIDVSLAGASETQRYHLPLAVSWQESAATLGSPLLPFVLAKARRGPRVGVLYDATAAEAFPRTMVSAIREGREIPVRDGTVRFWATARIGDIAVTEETETRRLGVEQSNTSSMIGDQAILKVYRRLSKGIHPEIEIGRFLTEVAGFENTPSLLGAVEHVAEDGTPTALAVLQGFVRNQGDGWGYTLDYLQRYLDEALLVDGSEPGEEADGPHDSYRDLAAALGRRTAELHRAFATPTDDPAFAAEPIGKGDLDGWRKAVIDQAERAFDAVAAARGDMPAAGQSAAEALLAHRRACMAAIRDLTAKPVKAVKTRLHGDYHLGQVVVAESDVFLLDFEGEPARTLAERRMKTSVLKDVGGMLRSFDYAASATQMQLAEHQPQAAESLGALAVAWRDSASAAFLDAYRETIAGSPVWPEDEARADELIALFTLEKALYEICYEAANRPQWLSIPVRGVLAILESRQTSGGAADG
ncbi:MAG: maltose alpha-D-glucosyltransferase [Rhodospirillaceae bacterium]|nr:maltose alpha-D-glucosyltransferase [Rhodospirillaceae bacterium]